ncbi:MAG TPA: hypothetical protein PKC30_00510 [Saprospiraceae bacterium]|nr:hypothetical protein [Saprospiraceae bacterium]
MGGGYPFRALGDTVVMSLSFFDTVYTALGSDIQKFAILGNPETSCKNLDRSAYFEQFVNGSGNKEKIQNMILPTGKFSILGDLWIFNILAHQYLFWNREVRYLM